ncbi:hypothetical protein U7Q95_003406 [Escherichia coli]|nr:hypothetical protein [Escherichia coli]
MTELIMKLGMIIFWFVAVVACGTAYVWCVIYAIRKGWLGEFSAKLVYFATFVALAAIVYKLPIL